jgi:hypothetical protein
MGGVAQEVEHLLCKCVEALSSNPQYHQKEKKEN